MDAVAEAYDGGPVAALRRIGFLLERGREDTYKVKAFRGAAAAILPLSDDEVRARVEDGTLTKLAGVGASSAKVIAAAIDGQLPERLAALEKEHGGPLTKGGHELRGRLRGDLHSHSDWSDGGSPIEEMAFTAIELGHEYQVLTDHSPRLRVANGLSVERLRKQLGVVDAINEHLREAVSRCSRASRSTSSTTAASTRPRRCSTSSTSGSPACTPSWPWTRRT